MGAASPPVRGRLVRSGLPPGPVAGAVRLEFLRVLTGLLETAGVPYMLAAGYDASMLDLQTEFVAVTQALHDAELDYAVCGGLAVAIHGAPRATKDIDLLVQEDDVSRVLEVLRPLGYRFKASPMRFPDGMRIQRVSKVEDGELMTVDLLLVGDESESAWRSRTRVQHP